MPDQTIIITGASDGIGAAAARQLAAKGERVVLVGYSRDSMAPSACGLNAPYHPADCTKLDQSPRDLKVGRILRG
jgi:short-subunit dehydrogenase